MKNINRITLLSEAMRKLKHANKMLKKQFNPQTANEIQDKANDMLYLFLEKSYLNYTIDEQSRKNPTKKLVLRTVFNEQNENGDVIRLRKYKIIIVPAGLDSNCRFNIDIKRADNYKIDPDIENYLYNEVMHDLNRKIECY